MNNYQILNEIEALIKNGDINELKNYFNINNLESKDYNNFNDILIYSIEKNASTEIIEFIMDKRYDKNLNFFKFVPPSTRWSSDEKKKVPLFIAIGNNNFRLADFLIKNNADIGYGIEKYETSVFRNLLKDYRLNKNNLRYLFNRGIRIIPQNCKVNFIFDLIRRKKNEYLEVVFRKEKNYIIELLNIYKNGKLLKKNQSMTNINKNDLLLDLNKNFKAIIAKDKEYGISVTEKMYEIAFNESNLYALKLLFENDNNNEITLIRIIHKYKLLKNSILTNDYDYIKKLLKYQALNHKCVDYESILSEVFDKYLTNDKIEEQNNIAKLLIKHFINSSSKTKDSNDSNICYHNLVLNLAIKKGNLLAVRYLVDSEDYQCTPDDINTKDAHGEFPIITCVNLEHSNQIQIFEYLLEHGADYNTKNNNGVSLLMLALYHDNSDMVFALINDKSIVDKININPKDINIYAKIIKLYKEKKTDLLYHLLKYFDVNQKDSNNKNIIHYAIDMNDTETIKKLIQIGIKIDNDILNYTVSGKNLNILKILLEKDNLPLNDINSNGETLLINVIKMNEKNNKVSIKKRCIVETLIQKGADVNLEDNMKYSPLSYSVMYKYDNIADVLLDNGASPIIKIDDIPLIEYIFNKKYYSIASLLINHGCTIDISIIPFEYLKYVIQESDVETLNTLINNKLNVNITDEEGWPLLYEAISKERVEMVKLLLNYNAEKKVSYKNDSLKFSDAMEVNKYYNYNILLSLKFDAIQNVLS